MLNSVIVNFVWLLRELANFDDGIYDLWTTCDCRKKKLIYSCPALQSHLFSQFDLVL